MPDKQGYSHLDIDNPAVRELVVANLVDMYHETRNHPQFRALGRQWYPKVQEATEKGVREHFGRSLQHPLAGPGIVSSVSPNMDWERSNINAFGELAGLSDRAWKAIGISAANSKEARAHNKGLKEEAEARGDEVSEEDLAPAGRSDEAKKLLRGLGIRRAPDANLLKAQKIMQGADPEKVISRSSAPKTFSFMHNIAGSPHVVTVDGRAFDMAVNQMRPWESSRGINSANLKTGKPTRYEGVEAAYKEAARHITAHDARTGERTVLQPHHLQAILWEFGKHIERGGLIAGQPLASKGSLRIGQPYLANLPSAVPARQAPRADAEPGSGPAPVPAVGRSRDQRRARR